MKTFHRYSVFTALCGLFLIFAGALVTSTGSGLSVPDWPLSYGTLFPKMEGGVFYEHGHRLIAGFVATLTVIMAVWAYLKIQDSLIRKLTYIAVAAVVLQAVLGGMTVWFQLPTAISVSHACLGQAYFCILALIALKSSSSWQSMQKNEGKITLFPYLAALFVGMVFIQLFLGAWMRHIGAGLAIPDFPKSMGAWIPPIFTYWTKVHFAHRVGALFILIYTLLFSTYIFRIHSQDRLVKKVTALLLFFVLIQVTLGSFVIWSGKNALITSLHVACGASILCVVVLLCAISFRGFDSKKSHGRLLDYISLGKPRITMMVCLTAIVGFFLASKGSVDGVVLFWTITSVFLVSFGACSFNQVVERKLDEKMDRTKNRPLPAGRLTVTQAMGITIATVLIGVVIMFLEVNVPATILVILSFLGYIFFYTPLKKITSLNTLVGAIPGALPPVIGWVAVSGTISYEAVLLFVIMFLWQLPHFLAIAWMFAGDYKKGSMVMLPLNDPTGEKTTRQALIYTLALVPISLIPSFIGMAGMVYFFGTLVISIWFLTVVYKFFKIRDTRHARKVLLSSLLYLPLVFMLLILDRM
jgi:protoheme IX farnesyltransferase